MTATLLALLLAATPVPPAPPPAAKAKAPEPVAADLTARPGKHAGGMTRCAACHVADDWKKVTFSHERTGFPLTGRHQVVTCQACHEGGRFDQPVPKACSACHRDVHARRLGARCDRCHDTGSWKEASFGPEGHRKTSFPLVGRHAVIPCEQCHGDRRDRAFARPATQCLACHQADYDRTALGGIPHAGIFPTECRGCHSTWRFSPATWPGHDACFSIRAGPHAGIRCRDCHSLGPLPAIHDPPVCSSVPAGAPPAHCTGCHAHSDPNSHPAVPGYLFSDSRCYECHRFSTGPWGLKAPLGRGGTGGSR